MYNLQDMVVMPHGKISSLNSAIIAYPRCQTTWQFIAFGNVFPSLQECCCLSLALLGMQLWQGCASIQRQAFPHGLHSWSGWLNALPQSKPESKTFRAGLLFALQSGGIWAFYVSGDGGKGLSSGFSHSWYCPAPSSAPCFLLFLCMAASYLQSF